MDNDIRSLKQLERLRPLLRGLASLRLGKNPLAKTASAAALRAWVAAQSPGLCLVLPADDFVDGEQRSGAKHANSGPGQPAQPVGAARGPPPPPTAQGPHPPPGSIGDNKTGPRGGGGKGVGLGESNGAVESASPPSSSHVVPNSAGTATPGDGNRGGGALNGCHPLDRASPHTPADAAFERLAQARNRAASSSWGAVALARLTAAENRPGRGAAHGGGEVARDSAGAWAASGRGAKLACNGMVRVARRTRRTVKIPRRCLRSHHIFIPVLNRGGHGCWGKISSAVSCLFPSISKMCSVSRGLRAESTY